ncbi:Tumor protein D52, partial [Galemys pyrenaicus]
GSCSELHLIKDEQAVIKPCAVHLSGMDCKEMEFYEDYQSPFDFDAGVNKNYLYLSPSANLSPPGSPTLQKFGIMDPQWFLIVHITVPCSQFDLARVEVEEEILTLSQVLAAKEKHLAEIKRKLGINSLQELKQNIAKGWQDVTATSAYKKTSETLSQAGQKASAAFSSVGSVITKKLEDVKNSPTFKSFEEKVENLKAIGGSKTAGGDFGEILNSTANASATATEPLPEQTQESL